MTPPLPLLLLMLELPVVMALLDCWRRPADHFAQGGRGTAAWLKWRRWPS